jgi:hypothetical protein
MERNMGTMKSRVDRSAKDREYAVAEARGRRERAAGLHATAARFDATNRRVVLDLTSGYSFGIPVARLREIRDATDAELREAEVVGGGTILHWESLDADYSVPALILSAVGTKDIARHFGRAGGKVTSDAKAEAARLNGAKGGRPRLTARKK